MSGTKFSADNQGATTIPAFKEYVLIVVVVLWVCMSIKTHQILHLKYVFTIQEPYHSKDIYIKKSRVPSLRIKEDKIPNTKLLITPPRTTERASVGEGL